MEFNTQTKIRYEKIRKLIGDVSEDVLLDVGAGKNPLSKGIRTKRTIKLDGVEDCNPDICCDICDGLPIENCSVDIIVAGEIIEHIYNPLKFLRECNRVLKFDGRLILSVPNTCSFINRIKVLFGQLPGGCAEPSQEGGFERHIIDFCYPALKKILEESGFKIIKKTSNGIISYSNLIWPTFLTPANFGETLIVKCKKIK